MQKKVRWLTNERQDLPDVQNLINFAEQEFDSVGKYFFCGGNAYVVRGFEINIVSGLDINCTVGVLVSFDPDGRMNRWLATDPQLIATVADNATNYVEAQIYTETGSNATRVFWDPTALGGAGQEFTQSIDTVTVQKVRLVVNQTGFAGDVDKTPVGIVVAAGAVIQRVHDNYKNTVYAGTPANPVFIENLFFSLNDIDNDGLQNRWNFGSPRSDKTIISLKDSLSSIQTQLADIMGDASSTVGLSTNSWVIKRPTDLFACNQDRNIVLTEGGVISWASGPGTLSFTSDFKIRLVSNVINTISFAASSPISLTSINDCAYVVLRRDTTATLSVTVANISAMPTDKDVYIIATRGTNGRVYLSDGTSIGNLGSGELGAVASPSGQLPPPGSIIPHYDFNGALVPDATYWTICDGRTVSVVGIGSQTLPDLSGRYLVGFGAEGGGDIDTAAWTSAAMGNSNHQININHQHTGPSHRHSIANHTHAEGTLTAQIELRNSGGAEYININRQASPSSWVSNWSAVANDVYDHPRTFITGTKVDGITSSDGTPLTGFDGTGVTSLALSTAQSIQPRSIRVRYYMRTL